MNLPFSPSECHAPFTCAAAKRLWPYAAPWSESLWVEGQWPKRGDYAAAQEAEHTRLLLKRSAELWHRLRLGFDHDVMAEFEELMTLAHK
jgi:hypothetical protein